MNETAIEEEREKRRAALRDLDDLRKAHRKLESDMGVHEIRAAEQRLLLDAKDEQLAKCEEEIRHLVRALCLLLLRWSGVIRVAHEQFWTPSDQ